MRTVEFPNPSIQDGHLYEEQYTYDITNGYRMMDALRTFVSENGLKEFLEEVKEELNKAKEEHRYAHCPPYYCYFNDDGKGNYIVRAWGWAVWQLMVGMFGNFGTSIRGGWIDNIDGALEFIDTFMIKPCPECDCLMEYRAYFHKEGDKHIFTPKWHCDDCDRDFDL